MNGVQADKSDYLGTKLALVLGGEAAALNTLLAKLRPYLHCRRRGVSGGVSDFVFGFPFST